MRISDWSSDVCSSDLTMIDTAEKIATDWFANHNAKGDKHEPYMEDGKVVLIPEIAKAYGAFRDAGFLATTNDAQYGGLQLPFVIDRACIAYFLAATIPTSGYAFLTYAAANLLLAHGTPETNHHPPPISYERRKG